LGILRSQAFGQNNYLKTETVATTVTEISPSEEPGVLPLKTTNYWGMELISKEITTRCDPCGGPKESDTTDVVPGPVLVLFDKHHVESSEKIYLLPRSADIETVIKEFENILQSGDQPDAQNEELRNAIARLRKLQNERKLLPSVRYE
jgi:hypothetical protein